MSCADNSSCIKLFNEKSSRVKELDEKRRRLLRTVSQSDLVWTQFPLRDDPKQEWKDAPFTIEVCRVVSKSGLFIPVTADETFCLAAQWKLFPLTSAVMDQVVYGANYAPWKFTSNTSPDIFDFEEYSKYLRGTLYSGAVCVGAHKLWLISGVGRRINYGLHQKKSGKQNPTRFYGDGWSYIQGEWKDHETQVCHWDYSQLLQLMRNLRTKNGKRLSIRKEIKKKNPALWYSVPPNAHSMPAKDAKRFP